MPYNEKTITISDLVIYPVKSLRGIPIKQAQLGLRGLPYDRHWMIVDERGKFVTQRQNARLALIDTSLDSEHLILSCSGTETSEIKIPLNGLHLTSPARQQIVEVQIWNCRCNATSEGQEVAEWLTQVTHSKVPLRLVRLAPNFERWVDQADKLGSAHNKINTEFADGFPYLLANNESLKALNQQLSTPIPMNRFRPNIVISGLDAFEEQRIPSLQNPSYGFAMSFPCQRCIITTTDQLTGERNPQREPLQTLKQLNPMPNDLPGVAFGMNSMLNKGEGAMIKVGDVLHASN